MTPQQEQAALPIRPEREFALQTVDLTRYFYGRRGLLSQLRRRPIPLRAVDGINLTIRREEIVGLVGESGCGKTTVVRLIAGLLRPSGGEIIYRSGTTQPSTALVAYPDSTGQSSIDVLNVEKLEGVSMKFYRSQVSVIFQDPFSSFDPRFTVKGILEEPLSVHGVAEKERRGLIEEILEETRLTPVSEFLDRYPHTLSGGQRQRLGIARALVLGPGMIVADEPVSMLDVAIRAQILELLLEERRKRRISMLFATHDLSAARQICDRLAVMYLGKLVEEGPTADVIQSPAHPYTVALIAAVQDPDPANRSRIMDLPIKGEIPSASEVPSGCRFHPRCPYAEERCRQEEPPLVKIGKNHHSACWFTEKVMRAGSSLT